MGTRIEIDLNTGDAREVRTTPYMVGAALTFVDEGQPIPNGATRPPVSDPNTVPSAVTRRQALLALLAAGKLDAVEQQMLAAPRAVQIAWGAAGTFERTNPLIAELAAQVGLDAAAVDLLFIEASKL